MYVYGLIDNREPYRYVEMQLFLKKEDAEDMYQSFGEDKKHYHIHRLEVIE